MGTRRGRRRCCRGRRRRRCCRRLEVRYLRDRYATASWVGDAWTTLSSASREVYDHDVLERLDRLEAASLRPEDKLVLPEAWHCWVFSDDLDLLARALCEKHRGQVCRYRVTLGVQSDKEIRVQEERSPVYLTRLEALVALDRTTDRRHFTLVISSRPVALQAQWIAWSAAVDLIVGVLDMHLVVVLGYDFDVEAEVVRGDARVRRRGIRDTLSWGVRVRRRRRRQTATIGRRLAHRIRSGLRRTLRRRG